jgi:hypothetical protein
MADNEKAANAQETEQSGKPGETPGADGKKTTISDSEAALLKENMAFKKKLKALEEAQAKAEEDKLKEKGEFQTLAAREKERAEKLESSLKLARLEMLAVKAGIVDPDLLKLADLSKVSFEDGKIIGAEEAIEELKAAKPYAFSTGHTEQKPTNLPKPNGTTSTVTGPATFGEWEKLPDADRYGWAAKNPEAFKALCERAKGAVSLKI